MGGKPRRLSSELVPGVWPVRGLDGHAPRESDGFQRPGPGAKRGGKGHLGHDIMFRRLQKGAEARPEYTPWYFCLSGLGEALAVAKGTIGIVRFSTNNGWWVEVKHGRYMTVYRHLSSVSVEAGQEVQAGHLIGIVGHAPKAGERGINHLHFEVWDMLRPGPHKRSNKIIDATPFLRRWKKLA